MTPVRLVLTLFLTILGAAPAFAAIDCRGPAGICDTPQAGALAISSGGTTIPILIDGSEDPGVLRAAKDLQADFGRVTGQAPQLQAAAPVGGGNAIIVGTLKSPLIQRLVDAGKLDRARLDGAWEAYSQQVVEAPLPGVRRALVIAGSDKRGAIFGIYDLSGRIGVSPWYWWADVPVTHRSTLFVLPGTRFEKPVVKYRGIFLNDEDPALKGWVDKTFGGFNHRFYGSVYELILRLKGNYLWPAMWGKSLYDDDAENAPLANMYGVVIGTSHHEPMMRAHVEWERYGKGPWDYSKNADALRAFWRKGIERMGSNESLVTVGMRGDGDEPMTQGTAITLLEQIVKDQRAIIADVTGKPAEQTPQVWALYKEVQDYYDKGMRVPDDVTLLFSDDNWGNLRRLPDLGSKRPGGYGIYYHFDYVGGPRNYKWINTNQIERIWQQMSLAHTYGADRLWIVNVGDLKPMEYPISFFLDMAWDPDVMTKERLASYPADWATSQFGTAHGTKVGPLLTRYAQLAARRKPELVDAASYDLASGEWDRVLGEWHALRTDAEALEKQIRPEQRDAYFQLVLHPILANANLHDLYHAIALNRLYAAQHRRAANRLADEAQAFFAKDAAIRRRYEVATTNGKWAEMMSQTHIGYTSWQQPPKDVMPQVVRVPASGKADMGVAAHNSDGARLPLLSLGGRQTAAIDIFNKGLEPFTVTARPGADWVVLDRREAKITDQTQLTVRVDWRRAPAGARDIPIVLKASTGQQAVVTLPIDTIASAPAGTFAEVDGVIAIDAEHFGKAAGAPGLNWQVIPSLGRTSSGVLLAPQAFPSFKPGRTTPHLDYTVRLNEAGPVNVAVQMSPGLDFRGGNQQRIAISIDEGPAVVVNSLADASEASWNEAVANNIRVVTASFVAAQGQHVVRLWAVDPGPVLQRILVFRGAMPHAYLGPAESARR